MKRVFCLLLSIALVLPVVGIASGVDVATLSDSELESLYEMILSERLSRRDYKSFEVLPGDYRNGVYVPAGDFRVVLADGYTSAGVNTIETERGVYRDMYSLGRNHPTEIGRMVLLNGDVLRIQSGAVVFYAETGGVTFK